MKTNKKLFTGFAAAVFAMLLPGGRAVAQEGYSFNHGPYIQGLTENGATIFFTTSAKGFSWVEAREKGGDDSRRFVSTEAGLIDAFTTRNAIRLDGLAPATDYEYRLVSKEMADFQPYKVTYGDSITSPWYGFRTFDPAAREFSFAVISDIHGNAEKYRSLISQMPMDSVQTVFLNGDVLDWFADPEKLYSAIIDPSTEMFATGKPFVAIRGNHETRGSLAREYHNYVYRPDGRYYGLYRAGDTAVVVLDCGEDKPDTHPVYAGIVSFDDYRQEQAAWLRGVAGTDEFTSARHRVVLVHIPPLDRDDSNEERRREIDHGSQHIYDLFVPILNGADIDLVMCGHTHRRMMIERGEGDYGFPVVINDNKSASFVHVSQEGIKVRTVDVNGNVVFERSF